MLIWAKMVGCLCLQFFVLYFKLLLLKSVTICIKCPDVVFKSPKKS